MGTEMTPQENALPHKSNNLSSDPQNPGKSQTQGCICTYPQEDGRQTRASSELTSSLVSCKADTVLNKGGGAWRRRSRFPLTYTCVHRYTIIHGMVTELLSATPEQVATALAVWVLGMKRGHQAAEATEAPDKCQPAALPWKESVVLTTDCLNTQIINHQSRRATLQPQTTTVTWFPRWHLLPVALWSQLVQGIGDLCAGEDGTMSGV